MPNHDYYQKQRDKETVRKFINLSLLVAAFGLFLTDCFGGHRELVRGQVRGREYTPDHYNGRNHYSASWQLYVRSPQAYEWVECHAQTYYETHDFDSITYSRQRTRWTNYTFQPNY